MARLALVIAVVGVLLAAAGLFVALAVGLPALGLNPYGRNPLGETLRGLGTAATLYATGAALLATATRWARTHRGPLPVAMVPFFGGFVALLCLFQAVVGYWTNIPELLFFTIGIAAPVALGAQPWSSARYSRPM